MGIFRKVLKTIEEQYSFTKNSPKEEYDFNSVQSIRNIPIPTCKSTNSSESPIHTTEYILGRKATEFKRSGQKDLAIECLKKANQLYPYSSFSWCKKDYMRLVEFLKDFGEFDMARAEEKFIYENYSQYFADKRISDSTPDNNAIDKFMEENKSVFYSDGSDLISTEGTARCCTCEECTKYRGRIFSVYGKDKRFPKLPDELRKMYIHKNCHLDIAPITFFKGPTNYFSPCYDPTINLENSKQIIEYVNRPFIDDRPATEKNAFEKELKEKEAKIQDKKDFDWLREHLPEIAPKSFGGYRKMKNAKSNNYKKLIQAAANKDYCIK